MGTRFDYDNIDHSYVGYCQDCRRMGDLTRTCLDCEGKMEKVHDYNSESVEEDASDFSKYMQCPKCKSIFKSTKENNCKICKAEGYQVTLIDFAEDDENTVFDQKTLPTCALVNFKRCEKCFHTAHYLRRQLRARINNATDIKSVVRAYEVTVEQGYAVNLKMEGRKRPKFTYEYSSLDLSPNTLQGLIQHHSKKCLCSICKWCIIIGVI